MRERGIGATIRGDDHGGGGAGTSQLRGTDSGTTNQGDWILFVNNHAVYP